MMHTPRIRRALLGAAVLAGGVAGVYATPPAAHAAIACRTDPILWVNISPTNDYKVEVSAAINTSFNDIWSVVYTVHAPAGTYLSRVQYTGGPYSRRESVQFVADNAPGTFDVTTTVYTKTRGHSVTASESVVHPGFASGNPSDQASGTDGQDIPTHVYQS